MILNMSIATGGATSKNGRAFKMVVLPINAMDDLQASGPAGRKKKENLRAR